MLYNKQIHNKVINQIGGSSKYNVEYEFYIDLYNYLGLFILPQLCVLILN